MLHLEEKGACYLKNTLNKHQCYCYFILCMLYKCTDTALKDIPNADREISYKVSNKNRSTKDLKINGCYSKFTLLLKTGQKFEIN